MRTEWCWADTWSYKVEVKLTKQTWVALYMGSSCLTLPLTQCFHWHHLAQTWAPEKQQTKIKSHKINQSLRQDEYLTLRNNRHKLPQNKSIAETDKTNSKINCSRYVGPWRNCQEHGCHSMAPGCGPWPHVQMAGSVKASTVQSMTGEGYPESDNAGQCNVVNDDAMCAAGPFLYCIHTRWEAFSLY